jgi:Ca2+-binding RTX toxin-like protein
MIRMSRRVSIFSLVVVMTVTVLATVAVALAQEEPLDEPQNEVGGDHGQKKVTICHNGHDITVAMPAWERAHSSHGDTQGACEDDALEPGTPEPPEGATLTTDASNNPPDSPATLPAGTISDTATLGDDVLNGTDGDIEFKLYGPFTTAPTAATAATDCVAANLVDNPSYTSTVAVDDHTAADTYTSATYTPTEPGIYQWTATFTPDAGQGDPTGEIGCGETVEQSVVNDGDATSTTGTEQNMTLAGEIGEDANLADPATDTTNIEGTTQNGNTTLGTDSEDDVLYGDASANKLLGGHGNDYLDGGKGRDRMVGGKQADRINGADGKPGDVINGGIGIDYCVGDVGDEIKNCDGNVVNVPLPSEAAAPAEARN